MLGRGLPVGPGYVQDPCSTPGVRTVKWAAICVWAEGSLLDPGADTAEGFQRLDAALREREAPFVSCACSSFARLYYLALPPSVYPQVCLGLKVRCAGGALAAHSGMESPAGG